MPDALPVETAARRARGITFDGVSVTYHGTTVLRDFSLEAGPGQITALIGPSGSGKTTALRAVAGFVRPSGGRLRIGADDVTHLPPRARDIGMVVQSYALFPHMKVAENVAFGLRARRAPDTLVRERVASCLRIVGMATYAERLPRELSGGQQQRVAIARALAIQPRVLLLDEPLSALDAQIRRSMVGELARLHRDLPDITILYVTHDQSEALTLADTIAILRDGRLEAHGASRNLYREPPTRFAAEFLGAANLLSVDLHGGAASLAGAPLPARTPNGTRDGRALLCLRPQHLSLTPLPGDAGTIAGRVTETLWQGELHTVTVETDDGQTLRIAALRDVPEPGARVSLHYDAAEATVILGE